MPTLTPDLFVVTDETTAAEIGTTTTPSGSSTTPTAGRGVNAHRRINVLLHDWQRRA